MATRDSSGGMPPIANVATASLRLIDALGPLDALCNSEAQADGRAALKIESHLDADLYRGTPEQLRATSLAMPHELPGQPGRPKRQAAYLPDGTLRIGKCEVPITRIPEARFIRRVSARTYEVLLMVPKWEEKRRIAEQAKRRDAAKRGEKLTDARRLVEAHRIGIAQVEAEMAQPDSEIVARYRKSLQYRMEAHQELLSKEMATVEELSGSCPALGGPSLTLAYSDARGTR